jgi:flagella basal body P-ring formation protein FlgA
MIVADVPPTTYVEYERLATEVRTAEAQKDLLAQFLREALGTTGSVVEFSSENVAADGLSRFVKARCLQCGRPVGEQLLVKSSVRREKGEGAGSENYLFSSRNAAGVETVWRVELRPFEAKYAIVAARAGSSGATVTVDDLAIRVCAPDLKCLSGSFDSVDRAKEKVQSWQGMRWNRNAPASGLVSEQSFAPDIVVKGGDMVKVIIEREGGLMLRTSGRALASGAKGSTIRVDVSPFQRMGERNSFSGSRKVIEATVRGAGEVVYGL